MALYPPLKYTPLYLFISSAERPVAKRKEVLFMNKTKKILIALACLAALFCGANMIGQHREARMDEYAKAHNCTWHYDYYITEEPVCK